METSNYDFSQSYRISRIEDIVALRSRKKSIYHTRMARELPAAFYMNQQVSTILKWINEGYLYEYTKVGDKPFFNFTNK